MSWDQRCCVNPCPNGVLLIWDLIQIFCGLCNHLQGMEILIKCRNIWGTINAWGTLRQWQWGFIPLTGFNPGLPRHLPLNNPTKSLTITHVWNDFVLIFNLMASAEGQSLLGLPAPEFPGHYQSTPNPAFKLFIFVRHPAQIYLLKFCTSWSAKGKREGTSLNPD